MTVPARLLAVRLQGFKSFASRTVVELGSGISAVVGPNGAGKSNLADALRWALGEQGRALRSRRSEDMIFAGSEAKAALGMAEVTVVVENGDGLLPVDYSIVELGRRLFRSGENEYLLNGTRVRLRDLEELLEAARLADNAFLFIGQGMVDQALSLRPEERRPLFEEVAGVRRHERRKRAAQEQLAESEANLARVRDILAELRPQARRLALQAQRQATRDEAATVLAEAIVAAGRQRWYEAARRLATASRRRAVAQAEMDAAIAESRAADEDAVATTEGLERRLQEAREARGALDVARAALQAALVADARRAAERQALSRERSRLEAEQHAIGARIDGAHRQLAVPLPPAPGDLATDALGGAAEGTPSGTVEEERITGARERLAARRRALLEEEAGYERALVAEREAHDALEAAASEREATASAAAAALQAVEERRRALAALGGKRRAAEDRLRAAQRDAARLSARIGLLDERLRDPGDGPSPAGAEPLAPSLQVEARLRPAVEAAFGAALRGIVVGGSDATSSSSGVPLVFRDLHGPGLAPGEGSALVAAAFEAGGGRLVDGLRADPTGVARRILERAVWVSDLAAARRLVAMLSPGWVITTVAGESIDGRGVLVPAPGRSLLALLEERVRSAAEAKSAERAVRLAEAGLTTLEAALGEAKASAEDAERLAAARRAERGSKVEAEAAAARRHELAAREAAWSRAQHDRLRSEIARLETVAGEGSPAPRRRSDDARSAQDRAERLVAWAAHRGALEERQRLEGSLAADLQRSDAIAAELALLAVSEAAAEADADRQAALLAELEAGVSHAQASLSVLDLDDGNARDRLRAADGHGRAARERLRVAEGHARGAEVEELEARMAFDAVREQLLVELAGLGSAGRGALGASDENGGSERERDDRGEDDSASLLEEALDAVAATWAAAPPSGQPPSPGRLAVLRRRYHELGAVNPFAADEHAQVQERLSALQSQRDDLERAIGATRRIIADLERLIVEQFQTTFRALETVFDRRFGQLFGGGHARLALTDPDDLVASGVEIIARPPGKKAQPLSMLSGGERALTAVALLFAMLEVRPVPFCVLDEVDAALDEANIGRFVEALRELAAGIQFVVITHNRGTIEQADALYGVTIGEDAVSRVVSLRLEGPPTIVARPRTAGSSAAGPNEPPVAVEAAARAS